MSEKKAEVKAPEFTIWIKPNGTEIKLNNADATQIMAEEMKWKKKGSK